MPEVDAVFSETRRGNHPESITRWGQLGLDGAWDNRDIAMYGRNAVSGTYGYFKDNALFGGDFRAAVNEQPGSSSVVQGVTESINGIGYSGIGYNTSGVRTVPLSAETGGEYAEANAANALNGTYPLSRFLYVYVNKNPNEDMDPMMKEFMAMILSRQGQEVVVRDGFVPLPANVAQDIRSELGIE
ncbi:MAG: substrate-binding domain-containing protein, partial [Natronospirillum sp.]